MDWDDVMCISTVCVCVVVVYGGVLALADWLQLLPEQLSHTDSTEIYVFLCKCAGVDSI